MYNQGTALKRVGGSLKLSGEYQPQIRDRFDQNQGVLLELVVVTESKKGRVMKIEIVEIKSNTLICEAPNLHMKQIQSVLFVSDAQPAGFHQNF